MVQGSSFRRSLCLLVMSHHSSNITFYPEIFIYLALLFTYLFTYIHLTCDFIALYFLAQICYVIIVVGCQTLTHFQSRIIWKGILRELSLLPSFLLSSSLSKSHLFIAYPSCAFSCKNRLTLSFYFSFFASKISILSIFFTCRLFSLKNYPRDSFLYT